MLNKQYVKEWINMDEYWINLMNKAHKNLDKTARDLEFKWGIDIIQSNKNTSQWSTKLSEDIVNEIYTNKDIKIWRPKIKNNYKPDFETMDEIIEVKTRSYTTTGTIGEKVLGCPLKYAEIPNLYKKPLKIILVAYQEYEAINNFKIINNISDDKRKFIDFFKSQGIEYIQCSKLL